MKNLILVLCVVCFSTISLLGQTKISDEISIDFPEEPKKNDTIVKDVHVISYYVDNPTASYIVSKVSFVAKDNQMNALPNDKQSLNTFYKGILKGQNSKMREVGFEIKNSTKIILNGFDAYQTVYSTFDSENDSAEYINLVLNEDTYAFGYFKGTEFNQEDKNRFLSSIKIDTTNNPSQFLGKSKVYRFSYYAGKISVYVVVIGLIAWLIFRKKKKNKNT